MGPVKSPVYAVTVDPEFLQEDFPLVFFSNMRLEGFLTTDGEKTHLVGGWTNPFEKNARQNGFIFPKFRVENKKSLSCHYPPGN